MQLYRQSYANCPGLAERLLDLISLVARPVQRIEVCFASDQLDADLTPEPHPLDGEDYLMVRGPFLPLEPQFMLPRSARA